MQYWPATVSISPVNTDMLVVPHQDIAVTGEASNSKRQHRSSLPGTAADPPARPAAAAPIRSTTQAARQPGLSAPVSAPALPAPAVARRPGAARPNSRFEELLSSDAGLDLRQRTVDGAGQTGGSSWQRTNSREAFLEELRYQRQLEKRLGMHKVGLIFLSVCRSHMPFMHCS